MSASPCATPAEGVLIPARHFAAMLGVSIPTFDRMKAAKKLPRQLAFSKGCHRWRRAEVLAWIDAGCPDQATWEAMKKAVRR